MTGAHLNLYAQVPVPVQDDFEGNGTISSCVGDDCQVNPAFFNPFPGPLNNSAKVLRYGDAGGLYSNIRFDVPSDFDLSDNHQFRFRIYVPSNTLTGNQPNQVSLKLQNRNLGEPWTTQCEIIKPLLLNQWQLLTFDFQDDPYLNFSPNSPAPINRVDFNRVLIQVNGENNSDLVVAFIDDFFYDGTIMGDPVYDQLVWSDGFDGNGPVNPAKWFHQTRLPDGNSWYNNEVQHYTNRLANSFQDNGTLKIVARKEQFTDQGRTKNYTSARLNSKFAFAYGRIEFRAKLLSGVGTWPALWTLGKNVNENGGYWDNLGYENTSWPQCGEMDVMEHWGSNLNFVQSATHTPSSYGATINKGGQNLPSATTAFHVYRLDWFPNKLVFSVDGSVHFTYNLLVKNADTWPFTAEQYLLMNVAIEGSISPSFTQGTMEVDYVRVYQAASATSAKPSVKKEQITGYPNPVLDRFRIDLKNPSYGSISVRLVSSDGRLIRRQVLMAAGNQLNLTGLESLSPGVYSLHFETDQTLYNVKLVK